MKDHYRDLVATALIAGGGGVILCAAFFGPWKSIGSLLAQPWFYGWAAALATAAVGFGAFYYAREAHKLRKDELGRHEVRVRDAGIATFNLLEHSLACRFVPHVAFSGEIARVGLPNLRSSALYLLAQSALSAIPDAEIPLGSLPFSTDELQKLGELDTNSRLLRQFAETLIAQNSYYSDTHPSEASLVLVKDLANVAADIAADVAQVRAMIEKYRPTVAQ